MSETKKEQVVRISPEVRATQKVVDALEELDEAVMRERVLRAAAALLGINLLRPVVVQKGELER